MNNEAFLVPNPATPCQALRIDPEICISCYRCADQCRQDVMVRNVPKPGGISKCELACPAGEPIRWTTYYIDKGRFEDALEGIRMENPFPGVCGRVCFHPCEEKCARIPLDEGIATNALERAAFDFSKAENVTPPRKRAATGKKVAVIGGGPAGLTCAYYLAMLGHKVTLYEAHPVAGGIPRVQIPEFRLPAAVVDREIKEVEKLGVEIKVNSPVDAALFAKLRKEDDAIFVATGAPVSSRLGVEGENLPQVIGALEFLRKARLGQKMDIGKNVVVIGGGNVATDSARLARRLGADTVTMTCLESRDIMPAYKTEVEAAEAEGVQVNACWGVKRIVGQDGKVAGVELKSCTSVFDKEGKFSPTYNEGVSCVIAADTVVAAIGQATDLSFADPVMRGGPRLKIDLETMETPLAGVFGGGDVGSQLRSIVQAIASGKRAAISIDIYLNGGDKQKLAAAGIGATSMLAYMEGRNAVPENRVPEAPQWADYGPTARQQPELLPVDRRAASLDEVNEGLSPNKAMAESLRCFRCSQYEPPMVLYPDECWFCGTCVEECPAAGAIRMEHPLNQRVGWKRKETGELFRPGMKNPPPPYTLPPVGDLPKKK
jgi:NADPH-dependent glutamate synthase beta subunit-like oxidoreductase/ferredoxin